MHFWQKCNGVDEKGTDRMQLFPKQQQKYSIYNYQYHHHHQKKERKDGLKVKSPSVL